MVNWRLICVALGMPLAETAFAQTAVGQITAADPGFPITSEFGPRILDNGLPDFHNGIDYGAAAGTPAPLIEAGTISRLSFSDLGTTPIATDPASGKPVILIFEFTSITNHHFRYLHMFNNTPLPIDSGGFTLTKTDMGNLCIVHWIAGQVGTVADYALASVVKPEIPLIGGNPVLDNQGHPLTTTNTAQSPVGPVGTSGGVPAHFHVDLGASVSQNPLEFISHAPSNFKIQFLDANDVPRPDGFLVNSNDAASSFIKVHVDSTLGKDMDSLVVFVDNTNSTNQVRTWSYGGFTPALDALHTEISNRNGTVTCPDPINNPGCFDLDPPVFSDGQHNGVRPQGVGVRDFVFTDWQTAQTSIPPNNLAEGRHQLIACWTNIINQTDCSSTISFVISRTPPTLTVENSQGILRDGGDTTDPFIDGRAVHSVANVSSVDFFQLNPFTQQYTPYPINVSFAGGDAFWPSQLFGPDFGYKATACDAAGNCATTRFAVHRSGCAVCGGPGCTSCAPPPGAPPASSPQPPPGQPNCMTSSPDPAGSENTCMDGSPPGGVPPGGSAFIVPGDPNHISGPNGSVAPGQLMTYTIQFENVGSGNALGVYITDVLDPALDDATLALSNMFSLAFSSGAPVSTTPAAFPFSYDPQTRTVTLLAGNAGPNQGGSFALQARLKSTTLPGTIIPNQALVIFPNALQQVTPTNTIVSAVPLPTQLAYVGASSGMYLSAAQADQFFASYQRRTP